MQKGCNPRPDWDGHTQTCTQNECHIGAAVAGECAAAKEMVAAVAAEEMSAAAIQTAREATVMAAEAVATWAAAAPT